MTQEELQQQLNGIKNTKMSMVTDKRIEFWNAKMRPVYQYDMDGNYLKTFESLSLVMQTFLDKTNIAIDKKTGEYINRYGFQWRHEKFDKIPKYVPKTNHGQKHIGKRKSVVVYNLDGTLYKKFGCVKDAVKGLYPHWECSGISLKRLQTNLKNKYVIKKV